MSSIITADSSAQAEVRTASRPCGESASPWERVPVVKKRRTRTEQDHPSNREADIRRRSPGLVTIALGLAVFVWTLGLFAPAVRYGFVDYDDREALLDNAEFRGLGPTPLRWMFTTFHMGHYQPLTWASLGLDSLMARAWFGDALDPRPYHATNVLLHALSAFLVFVLASRLFSAAFAASALREGWELDAASALAALLFAVHPLRAESVAWVTERRDVLSSCLLLLSVWFYLAAQDANRSRATVFKVGCWLAYLLSLLSRAMGVTLPVILFLLDIYPLRRLHGGGMGKKATLRGLLLEKIPFALLATPFILLAPIAQREVGAAWSWQEHGPIARVAQACYGLVHYLWKSVAPLRLSPIYELARPIDPLASKYVASFLLVVVAAFFFWKWRRRLHAPLIAAACYAVLLLPVLGFFQSGDQEVADRYSYLPGVVLAMLVAGAVLRLWIDRPSWKIPGVVLGVAVSIFLSVLTSRQIGIWKDSAALWTQGQSVAPNSAIAQAGYSTVMIEQGNYAEAAAHARRAIQIVPRNWQAHQNLWKALQGLGKNDELITALNESVRSDVMAEEAHNNLGNVYARQAAYDKSVAEYRAAIALRPDYAKARANLSFVMLRTGDVAGAEEQGRLAVEADPGFALARYHWAAALERLGRRDEAKAQYMEALAMDPTMTNARQALQRLGG